VVLAMILKLYLIGWLVNTDLSAAHAGVWTYMCAYGVWSRSETVVRAGCSPSRSG
jgi:hypothetical protein